LGKKQKNGCVHGDFQTVLCGGVKVGKKPGGPKKEGMTSHLGVGGKLETGIG